MSNNTVLKKKSIGAYFDLIADLLTIVTMIVYAVTTMKVNSFNKMVVIYMVLSAVCAAAYFLLPHFISELGNLIAVVFLTLAFTTFTVNSINTFADELNGISMFGSTGGITPIIIVMAMMFVGIILELASCFMKKYNR